MTADDFSHSADPDVLAFRQQLWRFVSLVGDAFLVHDVTALPQPPGAVRLRGEFVVPSDQAYRTLAPRLKDQGYTLLFRQEEGQPVLHLYPGVLSPGQGRPWLNLLLLIATALSVLWVGAVMESGSLTEVLRHPLSGWPFAASLLAILGTHELSHYFVSRRLGVGVSLPYFIPVPFPPFGTMGAFISMRTPPPNRRAALLIGIAGPLGGLALAVPILLLGLKLSTVLPLPTSGGYTLKGNSILYALMKLAVFGRLLPAGGLDVFLHQVAFAGWAGLLVTGLNLIPAGQLDGGHVMEALLGDRAKILTYALVAGLALLGLVWSGWFLWAVLVYFFGRRRAVPLDDVTPLTASEKVLAVAMVILFALVFTPIPLIEIMG